jgi:hypothetical protein
LADFHTNGIQDRAIGLELLIDPDLVKINNKLSSRSLEVSEGATINQGLQLDRLTLTEELDLSDTVFNNLVESIDQDLLVRMTDRWKSSLVDDVTARIQEQGIDLKHASIDGQPLLDHGTLNKSITKSSLESVGTLEKLAVNGTVNLSNTLRVYRNRVGINTESPDMALSVWDEEINLGFGKLSKNQAFIGTNRLQSLAIGINRTPMIEIDDKGLTTVKQLKVGRNRIAFEPSLPGYSGTKGDIVINSDFKPDGDRVFAWLCLGDFRWQLIKATA